jgi:undecaprenyl-diphosphatase
MIFTTKISSVLFKAIYILFIMIVFYKKSHYTALYLLLPFTTLLIVKIMQKIINRTRPFIALKINPLIAHKASGSFPSTHAASSLIIALCIGHAFNIFYIPLILLSLFTGLSRVATGLHYPLDVCAGFSISITIFSMILLF